jgi:hypothetical protein
MNMKTSAIALGLAAGVCVFPAMAAETVAKFEGAIGVDPVAGISPTNGLPVVNTVRGVTPGGRPWVIARFKGDIKDNGMLSIKGEGLLFAGGDSIGTIGPIQTVTATLFCGAQAFDTASVPLEPNGGFRIEGMLSAVPPNPCTPAVLLIRNAAGGVPGAWFAAGIPAN